MEIVQIDLFNSQATGTREGTLTQIHAISNRISILVFRATTHEPALGCNDQVIGIGVQGVMDQRFVGERPVRVGCVNKVDSRCDDFFQ